MNKYNIHITTQAHNSLREIVRHKIEFSKNILSVKKFADGFYEQTNTLANFPHRGLDMPNGNKSKVYKNHLIIYRIQEPNQVKILDIIDPRQYTVASKYY